MKSLNDRAINQVFKGILLWDIDGTLVRKIASKSSSIHLAALGLDAKNTGNSELTGLSDWDVLYHYGSKKFSIVEIKEAFSRLDSLNQFEEFGKFEAYEGVRELLKGAISSGWMNCILTGNTYSRAIYKLKNAELLHFFTEDRIFSCSIGDSRRDIAFRATQSLESYALKKIIVGDTEHDIYVAREFGHTVISVASGARSLTQLKKLKPDLLLANLKIQPKTFINFLEISNY